MRSFYYSLTLKHWSHKSKSYIRFDLLKASRVTSQKLRKKAFTVSGKRMGGYCLKTGIKVKKYWQFCSLSLFMFFHRYTKFLILPQNYEKFLIFLPTHEYGREVPAPNH